MMKYFVPVLFVTPLLFGCVQEPNYTLSASTLYLKEIQILDPGAPVKNDGIITELQGKYGEKVMNTYQNSAYEAKSARTISQPDN
ncbi:MAG: hypothetical protein ACI808_000406 [Paraglaciecola sp.]|jgi:hypothetical protein